MFISKPTITQRFALKGARLLYDLAGRRRDLARLVYPDAFHLTHSVHIHVPKAAGNSARMIVYGSNSGKLGAHVPAKRYRDASPLLFEKYFVFASVRHPLTRLRSAYHFLSRGGMNEMDRRWARKNLSKFGGFMDFLRAMEDRHVRDRIMREQHFTPQSVFVCDENGKPIVDFFVRTAFFETDMQEVCRRLHISFSNIKLNVSNPPYGKAEVEEREAEERCFDLYRMDYDVLGYGQTPPGLASSKS